MIDVSLLPPRIASKIDMTGECWLWTACVNTHGYGHVGWDGRVLGAHRVVYQILVGPIAEETLDHLCRVRHCVNPDHLEPVSMKVNLQRGLPFKRKSYCQHGHPLFGENLYVEPASGYRQCRECRRMRNRKRKARLRAERKERNQ